MWWVAADEGGGELGPGREAACVDGFAPGGERRREAAGVLVRNAIGHRGAGIDGVA